MFLAVRHSAPAPLLPPRCRQANRVPPSPCKSKPPRPSPSSTRDPHLLERRRSTHSRFSFQVFCLLFLPDGHVAAALDSSCPSLRCSSFFAAHSPAAAVFKVRRSPTHNPAPLPALTS